MINYKKIFSWSLALMLIFLQGTALNISVVDSAYAKAEDDGVRSVKESRRANGESDAQSNRPVNLSYNSNSSSSSSNDSGGGYAEACKGSDSDGLFSSLVCTGRLLFEDLRELIYIVAGFGIIAVGVGGIFGNLNWKWLGAIIISLVIIATAGELINVMLGDAHGIKNSTTEADAIELTLKE